MAGGRQIGAYRVLQQIGEGGMGSVWLAEHTMLGRRAAIKVLHPEYSVRPDIVTRFFNEARAATAISDPGIVQIFDFGQEADGSAYIVMELLDGETLDRRLSRLGRMPPTDTLRIMRQVASSLGAAHARGIVHRDLKPENIFIVKDPEVVGGERPKILDFGIAKLVGDERMKTQTSALMGTPTFMSPEQCRGAGQVDQRSDVYSLGCVLFTLLTGRPVFVAEGMGDVIAMHLREAPPAPSSVVPDLAPEIDQLVLTCLAKDPAQRCASAAELAIAIGALIGSSPQVAVDTPARSDASLGAFRNASTPTTLSSAASIATSPQSAPRSRALVLGIASAVAVAAIAIVIAAGAFRGDREVAPVPAPPAAAPAPATALPARMKVALERFLAWSRDHAGAPCPALADLGVADGELRLTCTEQPADQIAGVIAVDGTASWQLGGQLAELVRGERWAAAAPPPPAVAPPVPVPPAKKPAKKPARPPGPAKPPTSIELDENGIPISR